MVSRFSKKKAANEIWCMLVGPDGSGEDQLLQIFSTMVGLIPSLVDLILPHRCLILPAAKAQKGNSCLVTSLLAKTTSLSP